MGSGQNLSIKSEPLFPIGEAGVPKGQMKDHKMAVFAYLEKVIARPPAPFSGAGSGG
jgi:hypothetical protein